MTPVEPPALPSDDLLAPCSIMTTSSLTPSPHTLVRAEGWLDPLNHVAAASVYASASAIDTLPDHALHIDSLPETTTAMPSSPAPLLPQASSKTILPPRATSIPTVMEMSATAAPSAERHALSVVMAPAGPSAQLLTSGRVRAVTDEHVVFSDTPVTPLSSFLRPGVRNTHDRPNPFHRSAVASQHPAAAPPSVRRFPMSQPCAVAHDDLVLEDDHERPAYERQSLYKRARTMVRMGSMPSVMSPVMTRMTRKYPPIPNHSRSLPPAATRVPAGSNGMSLSAHADHPTGTAPALVEEAAADISTTPPTPSPPPVSPRRPVDYSAAAIEPVSLPGGASPPRDERPASARSPHTVVFEAFDPEPELDKEEESLTPPIPPPPMPPPTAERQPAVSTSTSPAAGPPGIATPGRPDDAAFADGAPSASAEPLNTRPPPTATIPVTADLVKQYELESAYECTICSEDVMDVGPHVASALRCGHTFGDACIRRWIKTRTAKKGEKARCPACMAPCVARDLRRILPKATIVRSDASANELVDKYQAAQQTIAALQVQLNKYQSLYQAEAEMGRLFHAEIVQLKQQLATRDHVKAKQGNCSSGPMTAAISPRTSSTAGPIAADVGVPVDSLPLAASAVSTTTTTAAAVVAAAGPPTTLSGPVAMTPSVTTSGGPTIADLSVQANGAGPSVLKPRDAGAGAGMSLTADLNAAMEVDAAEDGAIDRTETRIADATQGPDRALVAITATAQASDAIPELGHHSVTLPLATFGKPVVGSLKTLHLVDGHPMISQAIGLRHGLCRYDRYEPDATPRACTLHHHIIRDCDYHPKLGLALTVSTDMYAKLTDVRTSFRETAATKLATPLLSCTFGPAGRDYAMFVGGQDGAVYELDQRQPGRVVGRVDVSFAGHPGPRSRVLSLRALPLSSSSSSPPAILYAVPRGVGILRLNAGGRHDVHGSVTGRSGPRRPEPPNAPPHLTCLGLARLPPSDLVDPHGGPLVWSATWQAGQHVAHTFHRISPDQPYTTPGLIDSLVGHPRRPGGPIWRPETGAAVLVRRDFAFRPPSMARAAADPTMPYCVLYPGRRTPHGGADGLYMSAEDFDDVYTPTSHLSETGQPMIAVAYAQSGSDAVLATLHEGGIVVTTSV